MLRARCLSVALLALLAASAQVPPAAKQLIGFALSPTRLSLSGKPGEVLTVSFDVVSIQNPEAATFRLLKAPLIQQGLVGLGAATGDTPIPTCVDWLAFNQDLQIGPGGRQTVQCTLRIPSDAAAGSHYALLSVRHQTASSAARIGSAVQPALSLVVEVTVNSGALRYGLEAPKVELTREDKNKDQESLVLSLHNSGNLKTTVTGDVLLTAQAGSFPTRLPLPLTSAGTPFTIYPNATVAVPLEVPHSLAPATYRVEARCIVEGNRRMRSVHQLKVTDGDWKSLAGEYVGEAAYNVDLTLDPPEVGIDLPPGAVRSMVVRVTNPGTRVLDLNIMAADVRMEADGLMTYAGALSGEEWITVRQKDLKLEPRRGGAVAFQLKSPRARQTGQTRVACVVIRAKAAQADPAAPAEIGEFPVLVVAYDPNAPAARLNQPTVELVRQTPDSNPATAVVRLHNAGARIGHVLGTIELHKGDAVLSRLDIGKSWVEPVFPGADRDYRMTLPPLAKGDYVVVGRVQIENTTEWLSAEAPFKVTEDFTTAGGPPTAATTGPAPNP